MADNPPGEAIVENSLIRFEAGRLQRRSDWLAREEPLEIRVQGRGISITMRTPGDDAALAVGFLISEGLLHERSDVLEIAPCPGANDGNVLNVFLSPRVVVDFDRLSRHVFASSSCGLCGKASIEEVQQHFPPVEFNGQVAAGVILKGAEKLQEAQRVFARTGSLHGAALLNLEGELLMAKEDIGRHNAVDKVIGGAWLEGAFPLSSHILFVSGRTSFEITQKALAARIPVVAGISAPSSLAVEFAETSGQTLIGFVRGQSFNIYTRAERVRST